MKEYKLSTSIGKQLYEIGCKYDGYWLSDVYKRWSQAKQKAYYECINMYIQTEESTAFSICSHNTFGFTCSWLGKLNNENIMRIETKDNSYLIWLDR